MATGNIPNHVFSVPAGLDCIQGSAEDACLGDAIAAPVVRIYVEPAVGNPLDRWESCDSQEANPTPEAGRRSASPSTIPAISSSE